MKFWRNVQGDLLFVLHINVRFSYPGMFYTLPVIVDGVKLAKRYNSNIVTFVNTDWVAFGSDRSANIRCELGRYARMSCLRYLAFRQSR